MKKDLKEIFGDFYSPLHVLSYHKKWIFSIGSRSIGKSTGWLIWLFYQYLMYGKRFIYVRRTDKQISRVIHKCFQTPVAILHSSGFQIADVKCKGGTIWLMRQFPQDGENGKWEECGSYTGLNQTPDLKSTSYGDNGYYFIFFDEVLEKDVHRYLGSSLDPTHEYDMLYDFYVTVDRKEGVPHRNETLVIMCANLSTYYNPYFLALGIDKYIRTDSKIVSPKKVPWIVEQTVTVPALEKAKESDAYALGTSKQRGYTFEGVAFDQNNNEFVFKTSEPMQPLFNCQFGGHKMGVYRLRSNGFIYVSEKLTQLATLALTESDQSSINYNLARNYTQSQLMQLMHKAYYMGHVQFEDARCKYDICNYFMLTP